MSLSATEARTDFQNVVDAHGTLLRLQYYTMSGATTGYDDTVVLVQSGVNVWVSGVVFPVRGSYGSSESALLAQGRITHDDQRVYLPGGTATTPVLKVGIGSPVHTITRLLDGGAEGVRSWKLNDTTVYKQGWLRVLTNGSFIGE